MNAHSFILAVTCACMLLVGTIAVPADGVYALGDVTRARLYLDLPQSFYPPTGDEYNGYADYGARGC